ncbi:hypothetical protein PV350_46240, partial [Streptomyces sp. PA03-6a]|nr:hypothetical protein [Streptomyces sp. PA03-6a]
PGPARSPAQLRRSLGVVDGVAITASSTAATTSIGVGMGALAVRRSPYFATGRGTDADALTLPVDRTTV